MNLNYYVLGTVNNKMLLNYKQMYFEKLYKLIISLLSDKEIISYIKDNKIKLKDFLLFPEISAIINMIVSSNDELYKNSLIDILESELKIYLRTGNFSDKLGKGNKVSGTDIILTLNDLNPYNVFDNHPDHLKTGGFIGYGNLDEKSWQNLYDNTFNILKEVDIGFYNEINILIKKIIPLGTADNIHNSASFKECIGHLYLGITTNVEAPEVFSLEAIIHEYSHNKLNLIKQFDPILLNDYNEIYYSAIRPDARHIHGVFIGYHAFAPSMYIVMKAYFLGMIPKTKILYEKIILYYIKTKFLQKTIKKYAKLTNIGTEISKEIDYVILLMDELLKKINPTNQDLLIAKEKQLEHFKNVNSKYNLMY